MVVPAEQGYMVAQAKAFNRLLDSLAIGTVADDDERGVRNFAHD